MPGPDPAVAATRLAVREHLADVPAGGVVLVACSGGPDSVALAAALAFEAPRAGVRGGAVVVDHGLQDALRRGGARTPQPCAARWGSTPSRSSAPTCARAAPASRPTPARPATPPSRVPPTASARPWCSSATPATTRPSRCCSACPRGSGARSLSGMPVRRDRFVRPLLALPRATTLAACAAYGIEPWDDPHNSDDSFRRVRARRLLATLESDLGPGFAAALARSADLLREDADYLESLADPGARRAARRGPAATASTSTRSRPCPGRSAPASGGCSPPRPAHRSPTSAPLTSSRSTRC